jgi:Putative Actinobacterial Holin-X, holin superfamily III
MTDLPQTDDMRDRSTAELMKQLADETTTLVRQELELAKAEMVQKARPAGIGAGMFGAAAAATLLALGALTAFLILALDGALPSWLAALLVGLLWGAVAGVLAFLGRQRVREAGPPKPEQTVESVREDVEVAKTSARSGRQ